MSADIMKSKANPQRPTTGQLLGDALAYMRPNFRTFLLYGGGLIVFSKLIFIVLRWVQYDQGVFDLGVYDWPVFFLKTLLSAIFAYNVHRYVLLGQRKFSVALNESFWLFLAAVIAIELTFLFPGEFLESLFSPEWLVEWGRAQTPSSALVVIWRQAGAQIAAELLIFIPIAFFLTIPPSFVACGKINVSDNLKIGRALYWQIFWGLLILHVGLSLYAFLVGFSDWLLLERFMSMEDERYGLVSLTLRTVLLAPASFFYVLLGATFTSAALIRGSHHLGLPDPVREKRKWIPQQLSCWQFV